MRNLWDNKEIEEYIVKLYFEKKLPTNIIYKLVTKRFEKELLKKTNNQIKRDIGRIIHRKSENKKLNRKSKPLGKCPKCGKEVFARNRTINREIYSCKCEGNNDNTCDFKLTKRAFGIVLYNSVIENLLKYGQTKPINNLVNGNKKCEGSLKIDLNKKGFLDIQEINK